MMAENLNTQTPCEASTSTAAGGDAMDIEKAKKLFVQYRSHLRTDYFQLVQLFRRHNISVPLPNANYLHALHLTDMLFQFAGESLRILTGSIKEGIPDCLRKTFEEAVGRIKNSGGTARIVVLGDDSDTIQSLVRKYEGVLLVNKACAAPGVVIKHFIVGDKDMVRDEEPHGELTEKSDANEVKAQVYFKNPEKAKAFSIAFDAIWEKLESSQSK